MDLDPFEAPAPAAFAGGVGWQLGSTSAPAWTRRSGQLDAASVHELLRRADLPLSELRHMGWKDSHLRAGLETLPVSTVSPLLGRVLWDHVYGNEGQVWVNLSRQCRDARRLGHLAIREYFHVVR